MSDPINIIVVDDHPLMRKGIVQFLSIEPDFNVVAEAGSGAQAVELCTELEPDVVLLDLNMKGLSGLDTLKLLREKQVSSTIIILTVSDSKQDVIKLINAGADGYLLKDMEPEQLHEQLKQAAAGKQVLSEELLPYLNCLHENDEFAEKLATVTKRELQTLNEIAKGASNREVASSLKITEGTVKVHVKSLLRKLNAKSRVELTVMYLEHMA
ncbi:MULTISPECIES: two-component system response regulator NarL [unclassified Agarivorans]|uniref:two-component system response regulator NarL n=1 Tax=unclassified Agarivorans TaxID=2636026 RepID=UPI0010D86960|nr:MULTISPECIES: two-component system response regulator NarL [unclassified Agarivorans]MDO6686038.1 two-component system response regulator NarL [Agarivorans sp. 3_MG-2023]MDO6713824.1 two-component system response regulator NarL [Agarivorans sp. 2_MG-2023]MDO6762156.1 two-component system response regulator NarL [Agarivorans sp. 1_MG-2023]GDY25735.1 DNA-binding response regulator [Agarivorans sp. Toyoura001]